MGYILRQIGFFLCFDGVISSLCMACLFKFGDDLYDFMFSRMERMLFWMFYFVSCCCCICCDHDQDTNEYMFYSPKHHSSAKSKRNKRNKRNNNESKTYNAEQIIIRVEINPNMHRSMSMNDTDSNNRAEPNGTMQNSISMISDLQQSIRTD